MADEAISVEKAEGADNTVQNDPDKGASNADNTGQDDKSVQNAETVEQVKQERDTQIQKLTEGWKEDRDYYQNEIKSLRSEAKNPKLTTKEEDELEGLEENERVEKIIEFREKRKSLVDEAELKAAKSEVRFYERTDEEFAKNKKDILKVASDYDCKDLKQAILVWRGLNSNKVAKDAQYHSERKKEADGKAGGKAGGTTAGKPYDPKTDSKKSFGDFYREGGI